ncbi:MAG: hypothetical protein ACT4PU_01430 [Planctomycetota bacterium]
MKTQLAVVCAALALPSLAGPRPLWPLPQVAPPAPAAPSQDANPYRLPEDLLPFWSKYSELSKMDDESGMDKLIRTQRDPALRLMDLLLDETGRRETPELNDELRALARSLDRIDSGTRFIERVRFVRDLTVPQRRARTVALDQLWAGYQALTAAQLERSETAWAAVLAAFDVARKSFEQIGDVESQVLCLQEAAEVEKGRGRLWEFAVLIAAARDLSTKLPFKDPLIEYATKELERLLKQGIDPTKDKPGNLPAPTPGSTGAAPSDSAGRGLTSFAAGATEQRFPLEMEASKKGLGPVMLPGFAPPEQFLLWPVSWVGTTGNEPLGVFSDRPFRLFGQGVSLLRGDSEHGFDTNGDGKAEVSFQPSSNPQRVDLPAADGKSFYPLMVCVPSDREAVFGLEVNYAPTTDSTRLRYHLGGAMVGKVLGETWSVYDANVSGVYGDTVELGNDLITRQAALARGDTADPVFFADLDAVLIGKAKAALPWSTVLPVGDGFQLASIDPNGQELVLQKLNLQTGSIKLDMATAVQPAYVILQEVGALTGAYFNVVPAKKGGSVTVPAGKYHLLCGRIQTGSKSSLKQVRIYRGRSQPFEVAQGATFTLALGAPFNLQAGLRTEAKELIVEGRSLRVYGRGGEEYAMFFDEALQPDVELRSADDRKLSKPQRMPEVDIAAWQEGPVETMWFPMDLRLELKEPKVKVLLSQKSHPLLGGPFQGEGSL